MKWRLIILIIISIRVSAQPPPQQPEYQLKVRNFINDNLEVYLKKLRADPDTFKMVFRPCLEPNNISIRSVSPQALFRTLFLEWLKQAFNSSFPNSDLLYNYFGRVHKTRKMIYNDIEGEIKSESISQEHIRTRLTGICDTLRNPPQNQPPTAMAGDDQVITFPENKVTLYGKGSDPENRPLNYQWSLLPGSPRAEIISPDLAQTDVTGLMPGTYQFELRVKDDGGKDSSDIVMITVIAANKAPVAIAGIGRSITLPIDSVHLLGSGTDSDGRIIAYKWNRAPGQGGGTIVSPDQKETEVIGLTEGSYEFELIVTDDKGATGRDSVTITVNPAVPPDPKPNWPLIIAIILVVGGAGAAGYYKFVILPRRIRKKVVAYFLHEYERAIVKDLMPGAEFTDGYAVGHTSNANIDKMKGKGLALLLLNTSEFTVNTPGVTRTAKFSFKKGIPKLESITKQSKPGERNYRNVLSESLPPVILEFPAYYIITLDGPLLPGFRKRLKEIGVDMMQYVPDNSYVIRVYDQKQLDQLNNHHDADFIRMIDRYSAADTGFIVRKDRYTEVISSGAGKELELDLVLHSEDDMAQVEKFLNQHDIKIIRAFRNNIRVRLLAGSSLEYMLAANKYIQAIYEYVPPVISNNISRQLIGIDNEKPPLLNITENGDGELVAVADTGIDRDHPDLRDRIDGAVAWGRKSTNDVSDTDGHGTHVAGSIAGNGSASGGEIKGMAPGARIFFQSLLDEYGELSCVQLYLDKILLEAYNNNARIHNNSWGAETESRYTVDSSIVDQFVFDHPEMLIVIAAGNDGSCETRAESEKGYVGFGSVGSPATNKNAITVGASRNKRTSGGYATSTYGKVWKKKFVDPPTSNELVSGDPQQLAAFSSRGPCDDDRIKPDIVAPGTDILSAKSGAASIDKFHGSYENDAYAFFSGTSMATPMVSGAAAIIREYYRKKRGLAKPSAALIKATLINGTKKLTGWDAMHGSEIIPNPNQGYGMLDLLTTIPNESNSFTLQFYDSLQDPSMELAETGDTFTIQVKLLQSSWLRVCMAYTDTPARAIQNDLDLIVDYDATPRIKWGGNKGINAKRLVQREEDRTNNTEIIRIDEAQPGVYTIKVIAYNIIKGKQGFALVVSTGDQSVEFSRI